MITESSITVNGIHYQYTLDSKITAIGIYPSGKWVGTIPVANVAATQLVSKEVRQAIIADILRIAQVEKGDNDK